MSLIHAFTYVLFSRNLESALCLRSSPYSHFVSFPANSNNNVGELRTSEVRVLLRTSPSLVKHSDKRLCWETREKLSKILPVYAKVQYEDQSLNPVFTNLHFFENELGKNEIMPRPWKCLVTSTVK